VALGTTDHGLVLDPEAVAAGAQTDLDEQGIAKNARQEKLAARKAAKNGNGNGNGASDEKDERYHQQMAQMYRQHVLKEEAQDVMQIQGLKGSSSKEPAGIS
jgi:hypothetical protein